MNKTVKITIVVVLVLIAIFIGVKYSDKMKSEATSGQMNEGEMAAPAAEAGAANQEVIVYEGDAMPADAANQGEEAAAPDAQ